MKKWGVELQKPAGTHVHVSRAIKKRSGRRSIIIFNYGVKFDSKIPLQGSHL